MPQQQSNQPDNQSVFQDEQTALEERIRNSDRARKESYQKWLVDMGHTDISYSEYVDRLVEVEIAFFHHFRAEQELDKSIIWDHISSIDRMRLKTLLDQCPNEQVLHSFLEDHPEFLVQVLGGGHGRHQISKKRLGAEHIPDFLIADEDSLGINWYAVEIKLPCAKVYRRDGGPRRIVYQATEQVREWRSWLAANRDYARRPKDEGGLGLIGIDSRLPGLILIGRREEGFPEQYNEFRRDQRDRNQVVIHSYDWLLDAARRNQSGSLYFELRDEINFRPTFSERDITQSN